MPQLPTIDITDQAMYDRVVAVFPGDTQAEKATSYREWLRKVLKREVLMRESIIDRASRRGELNNI